MDRPADARRTIPHADAVSVAGTDVSGYTENPEWTVVLEKSQEWASYGLGVAPKAHYIEITEVKPLPSYVAMFNQKNPSEAIQVGDRIVALNGVRYNLEQMMKDLAKSTQARITLHRPQVQRESSTKEAGAQVQLDLTGGGYAMATLAWRHSIGGRPLILGLDESSPRTVTVRITYAGTVAVLPCEKFMHDTKGLPVWVPLKDGVGVCSRSIFCRLIPPKDERVASGLLVFIAIGTVVSLFVIMYSPHGMRVAADTLDSTILRLCGEERAMSLPGLCSSVPALFCRSDGKHRLLELCTFLPEVSKSMREYVAKYPKASERGKGKGKGKKGKRRTPSRGSQMIVEGTSAATLPIAVAALIATFFYSVVELLLRACGYRRPKIWPPIGVDLIALRGEVAEAPVGKPNIPPEFSQKIEAMADRVQAAAGLQGDWKDCGRERGVQVSSQAVTQGSQMMRGEAIAAVPLRAVKDALLTSGASTINDAIETSKKVKDCGPQTFISCVKYRKRMFSSPRECYLLTHWRVLDNGALLFCSQSLTNEEDSVVPLPGDGTSSGYVRASLGVEGWLATQQVRGSDGMPATSLVYVVEGETGSRTKEQEQPLQVSRLIRSLNEDPEMVERYENAPPLRNEC
jgi:hypothetical protein